MEPTTTVKRVKFPAKTIMSFWRSRLYRLLRQDILLRSVTVRGGKLIFESQSWEEYWQGAFRRTPASMKRLYEAWRCHQTYGFLRESGLVLGNAYMETIRDAMLCGWPDDAKKRLLSLENTVICREDSPEPLAAMTANFRNPLLLLRQANSNALPHYNDTLMLPLIAAGHDKAHAFFHYRRQGLLQNTNDALLFFPRVDLSVRRDSFRILQELVDLLVHEWGSRIEQRASLIADKVITPLLPALRNAGSPIRILDIGSGPGLFSSRLLKHVCRASESGQPRFELTMLDLPAVDHERYFQERTVRSRLAGMEYIRSDYAEAIQKLAAGRTRRPIFDIALILKMLHNISGFGVTAVDADDDSEKPGRYEVGNEVSDYFRLFGQIFPDMVHCKPGKSAEEAHWLPERKFNADALLLPDGKSLIEAITRISRVTIIEDGDLRPEMLDEHKAAFKLDDVILHNLPQRLRLGTSFMHILARKGMDDHLGGGTAWLN